MTSLKNGSASTACRICDSRFWRIRKRWKPSSAPPRFRLRAWVSAMRGLRGANQLGYASKIMTRCVKAAWDRVSACKAVADSASRA